MTTLIFILLMPFGAFVALILFGRFFGKKGASFIGPFCMFLGAVASVYGFLKYAVTGDFLYLTLGTWFRCGDLVVEWGFMFDSLSITMFVVVCFVSCCVHLYSVDYMGGDPYFVRFMSYISLFTFFMLFLVSSDNFVQMLVGWEGVGICSFLLVSFWFSRPQAVKSAIKALLFNRVGDCGLLIGMFLIFKLFRTLNFDVIFLLCGYVKSCTIAVNFFSFTACLDYLTVCCLFLLLGVFGKSAQVGLHCWLPDAMEGPTPVSALIHAATMVTAGVFLVLRCSFIFELCPTALNVLIFFGSLTVFFGSIVGLTQFDIKKIIAYSTCSQLGYMLAACGFSNYNIAFFHLVNHAFIKALLFLSAGIIISKLGGEQDIRRMGGLQWLMPLTYVFMLVGSLSLAGFPFLSGYYSKDLILEFAHVKITILHHFVFWFVATSTFFTSFYSFRLIFLVFMTKTNTPFNVFFKVREVSFFVAAPLMGLTFLSIFSGYLLSDLFLGFGSEFFLDVFPGLKIEGTLEAEFLPFYLKLLPSLLSFLGYIVGMNYDSIFFNIFAKKIILSRNINCAFFIDSFYNRGVVLPFCKFALVFCFRLIDKHFLELCGPKGFFSVLRALFFSTAPVVGGRVDRLLALTLYFMVVIFLFVWFGFV